LIRLALRECLLMTVNVLGVVWLNVSEGNQNVSDH